MIKWNVAAYLRLSSDDGDKIESNSITNQKHLIENFIKNNDDLNIVDFYIDDGYTGTDFNRPDFQRLLMDMKNEKINSIIVKDLSRLGRNYIEVGNYIEQIFPLYNIRFIAINDSVDSFKEPSSVNNVLVPFKNLMNDEYARDISNKVKSTLKTMAKSGKFIGMSAPYGYLIDPNDKYKFIIDEKASKVVKIIFKLIIKGKSKQQVVDKLNKYRILPPAIYKQYSGIINCKNYDITLLWNTQKLDGILKNQVYIGDLIQAKRKRLSHKIHTVVRNDSTDWIVSHNHHKPIISEEDFMYVQENIYGRDIRVDKKGNYDAFSGHLKCPDCGNSFSIKKSKKYTYYDCTSHHRNKECSKHTIEKTYLQNVVLCIINNQIQLVTDLDNEIEEILDDDMGYDLEVLHYKLEDINNNILKYDSLKNSLFDDLHEKLITDSDYNEYSREYEESLNKYLREKKDIEEEISNLEFKSSDKKNWIEIFKKNKEITSLSKKVIDELIDNIFIYSNGNIIIRFKYEDDFDKALNFIGSNKLSLNLT